MKTTISKYPEHIQEHYDRLNIHGIKKEQGFTERHLAKLLEKLKIEDPGSLTPLEKLEIWAGENLLKIIQEAHDKIDKVIRGH